VASNRGPHRAEPIGAACAIVYADDARIEWSRPPLNDAVARVAGRHTASQIEEPTWMCAAFRDWAVHPGAFFAVMHGEVLARD